jgi:hypothetical protein
MNVQQSRIIMPNKKKREIDRVQSIIERVNEGYSKQYAFLHIPKTGGTSLIALGKKLVDKGYSFPVCLGHSWRAQEVLSHFPKMKLTIMLRDPLERIVSGFNSRLRQGRPTYDSPWTLAEASVMAMLPSVRHLLDAMLADDEFSISAVAYANSNVSHLHHNYSFYLKNRNFVVKNQSMFHLVGHMKNFEKFVEGIAELSQAPIGLVRDMYQIKHSSSESSSSILEQYSNSDLTRLKEIHAEEYAIYNELCRLADDGGQ